MDTQFPIRTCNKCANVLVFTYTCHSETDDTGNMSSKLRNGGAWKFICRACKAVQHMTRAEVVCNRATVCRMLDTRESLLKTVLPENPRPRSFGDAGKLRVEDLLPIMHRPRG